jgi:D12 class N6 adenine-specific DNA methyltransferase
MPTATRRRTAATPQAQRPLQAPFPYFGGKSRVAPRVWDAFGEVKNYVEPFFGSGAVLLARPADHRGLETVNDKDGLLSNFWRAVQADPVAVAQVADWPVNENDLHARHAWLVGQKDSLQARLEGDPAYYDPRIAGWWVWGMACWIGAGFCTGKGPWHVVDGQLVRQPAAAPGVWRQRVHLGHTGKGIHRKLVHLGDAGQGVKRQLVHLSDAGQGIHRQLVHLGPSQGVHRKLVHLGDAGQGVHRQAVAPLVEWFQALQQRLRRVRVCCGDWQRVCGPTPTTKQGLTGVFLDPPYSHALRDTALYRMEADIVADVQAWCLAHGDDPQLRIVLCGYDGEYTLPATWTHHRWTTNGGYGNQGTGRGRANAARECLWLSPHCLPLSEEP